MKKEIINIKVLPKNSSDKELADSLKVEILVSQSDFPIKKIRSLLGELPEDFVEILRNSKVLVNGEIKLQFIYPDMTRKQMQMMNKLFYGPSCFCISCWKKDSKYNGYLSNGIYIFDKRRLIPYFVGSMVFYNTNGLLTGSVKFRVRYK